METLHVLVVDDEVGMRAGVQRALRGFTVTVPEVPGEVDFAVAQAESGEEALAAISASTPDILLLDHKLPGMSGLDVLAGMVDLPRSPLTIMITAYASIETAVTATKRGAYDFLAKPFTPNELKSVVRKAAGRLLLERQARKLADEKRRVRFEFIRVLGHELKAPLGAVTGYLDLMERRSLGDELSDYSRFIERSQLRLEQMRKLIVDLLDMTRIESGQARRELIDLDLTEALRAAVELAEVAARERSISIHLHAPDRLPIHADRNEIDMVLNNLLSNAVKYNRDGGSVEATLAADGEHIVLTVADTGIGMSQDEVATLFGEFVRIKNAKTRDILGSGLGLSIVKKIAQLYNGDVIVESEPGVGTTFTLRIGTAAIP